MNGYPNKKLEVLKKEMVNLKMSSQAPPKIIDTTLQKTTKDYQKRQVSDMKWGQHIKTFYKSTRIYGYNHADSMRHIGRVYQSGR